MNYFEPVFAEVPELPLASHQKCCIKNGRQNVV